MPTGSRTGWLRVADAACLLLVVLTIWVAASGGMRLTAAGVRISLTSPARLGLIAAAALALRHLIWRRPSFLASVRSMMPRRRPSPEWRITAPVWAVSRASVILVGFFAVLLIGVPPETRVFRVSDDPLLNLPARWDAEWYLDIAANGYRWVDDPERMQNVAFFPAVPLTMRVGGALLGAYRPGIRPPDAHLRLMLGGWLIALGTFWLALVYVHRWAASRAGPDLARDCITLLAAYPFAAYFSAPYSEPLYLASITAALLHFERAEWRRAAAWGAVAALVRPTGVLLIVPLAWMALRWRAEALRSSRFALTVGGAVIAPALALLAHSLMLYGITGEPLAWSEAQVAWGRTYQLTTWLGVELSRMAGEGVLHYVETTPITVLNALGAALAFAMLWPVARRAGVAYALLIIVNLVPAIASGGLMSVGRFTSTLFPVFFALASIVPARHLPAVVTGFAALQGFIAVLFFTWRPPF